MKSNINNGHTCDYVRATRKHAMDVSLDTNTPKRKGCKTLLYHRMVVGFLVTTPTKEQKLLISMIHHNNF